MSSNAEGLSRELGLAVKRVMVEKDITQVELADKMDMHVSQLNETINGKRTCRVGTWDKIAEALDMEWKVELADG